MTEANRSTEQGAGPQAATKPSRSGDKVTVALKMPHGIVMQLYDFHDIRVPTMGGYITEQQARKKGEPFTLNGYAAEAGKSPRCIVAGGYALTPGVPRDFYEAWIKQNAEHDLVLRKLIFAYPTTDGARDKGEEREELRCGLEPLNGDDLRKDPRVPEARSQRMRLERGERGDTA